MPDSPHFKVDLNVRATSCLAIGYDVLANGFGERIYSRRKGARAECPFCGKWSSWVGSCDKCGRPVNAEEVPDTQWVAHSVEALLHHNHDKFFFPRMWNNGRPWISRDDLQKKLTEYLEEKSNVQSP